MVLKAHKIEPVFWRIGKRWASLKQLTQSTQMKFWTSKKKKKKKAEQIRGRKTKKYFNFCLMLRHNAGEKEIPFKRRESPMSDSTVAPKRDETWKAMRYCNFTYKSCIIIRKRQDCPNSCAVNAPTEPVPSVTCFQRHRTATSTN